MKTEASQRFQTFEDLEVYKAARLFRKEMYSLARTLPDFEKYGLCSQIRRAAVSLTNNIAEGHGRYHYADQIRFLLQARGSLQELIEDINVCEDENYTKVSRANEMKQQGWSVLKLLNGYLRHLRDAQPGKSPALREIAIPYRIENGEDSPFN